MVKDKEGKEGLSLELFYSTTWQQQVSGWEQESRVLLKFQLKYKLEENSGPEVTQG